MDERASEKKKGSSEYPPLASVLEDDIMLKADETMRKNENFS